MMLPDKPTPPVSDFANVTALLYGAPKIGKSTFCAGAPNALFLATENGLNHLAAYQAPIGCWADFLAACKEIAKGGHDFKTIVIDTVDNLWRLCVEFVRQRHGVSHESEVAYGRAYSEISEEFQRVLTKLSMLPYGLAIISHSQTVEVQTRMGKASKIIPTLPEKARRVVLGMADIILYCDIDDDGNRVARTKPTTLYEAGDRTGRLPEVLPLSYQALEAAFNNHTKQEGE